MNFKKVLKVQGYVLIVIISTFAVLYTSFSLFGRSYAVEVGIDNSGIPTTDFSSNYAVGSNDVKNYVSSALSSDATYTQYLQAFNVASNYKINNMDMPLYSLMKNLKVPETDEVFELHDSNPSDIKDLGILYIINHGYNSSNTTNTVFSTGKYGAVSDNGVKQYITQIALWLYIYDNENKFANTYCMDTNTPGLNACSFNLENSTTVISTSTVKEMITKAASVTGFNYLNYILELVQNAESVNSTNTSSMAVLADKKLNYTISNNLFVTEAITPSPSSNKENYLYYTLEILDPNNYGVYVVDQNNSKITNTSVMNGAFKVVVPLSEDIDNTDLSSVKINVYGTFIADKGFEYYVTKTGGEPILNVNKKQVFQNVALGYTPVNRVLVDMTLSNLVKISKLDATTKEELPGASLVITKDDDDSKKWEWISGTKPYYLSLDDGNYTLCETKAPAGYVLNKECVKFKVDNSKILSVVMENNVEIPNTASIGSISTYIFGGIVVLFGTMIIAVTIKKKKVSEISQ